MNQSDWRQVLQTLDESALTTSGAAVDPSTIAMATGNALLNFFIMRGVFTMPPFY